MEQPDNAATFKQHETIAEAVKMIITANSMLKTDYAIELLSLRKEIECRDKQLKGLAEKSEKEICLLEEKLRKAQSDCGTKDDEINILQLALEDKSKELEVTRITVTELRKTLANNQIFVPL